MKNTLFNIQKTIKIMIVIQSAEEKDKLRKSALKVFNIEKNTVEEYK